MKKQIYKFQVFYIFLLIFNSIQCSKENNTTDNNKVNTWETVFSDDFQRDNGLNIGDYMQRKTYYSAAVPKIYNGRLMITGSSGSWRFIYLNKVPGNKLRLSLTCTLSEGLPSFGIFAKGTQWEMSGNAPQAYDVYSLFVDYQGVEVNKILQTGTINFLSKTEIIYPDHTYKLQFVIINNELSAFIQNINDGIIDSVKVIDNGPLLNGASVGFDGNLSNTDTLFFDDFKVEIGK